MDIGVRYWSGARHWTLTSPYQVTALCLAGLALDMDT